MPSFFPSSLSIQNIVSNVHKIINSNSTQVVATNCRKACVVDHSEKSDPPPLGYLFQMNSQ
jgi:hypothetical protein